MSPHTEKSLSRKSDRNRTILLAGIALVMFATVGVQYAFNQRKKSAAAAQAARPEVRARTALADADRYTLEQKIPEVLTALKVAKAALDEALSTRSAEIGLLRARLVITRRLAYVHAQLGHQAEAREALDDAVRRAGALFEGDRTSDRARTDRLTTARELAVFLRKAKQPVEAYGVLLGAAESVGESLDGLNPSEMLQGMMTDIWLDTANAAGEAKRPDAAMQAAHRALEQAEAASKSSSDPSNALARIYRAASTGATLADQLERPEVAGFEQRIVEVQKLRVALTPDADSIRRSWSIWLAHIADRAVNEDRDADAKKAFAEAVKIRRFLARRRPADMEVQVELVRALNAVGAWHSKRGRNEAALKWYAEAAEAAKVLPNDGGRMRLVALGNQAHMLGRLDKMVQARVVGLAAYTLAQALAKPGEAAPKVDAARAGLRYARVLRARPKPQKVPARVVVQAELARLEGLKVPRADKVRAALVELSTELGR